MYIKPCTSYSIRYNDRRSYTCRFWLSISSYTSRNSCLSICELWITRVAYAASRKRKLWNRIWCIRNGTWKKRTIWTNIHKEYCDRSSTLYSFYHSYYNGRCNGSRRLYEWYICRSITYYCFYWCQYSYSCRYDQV